MGFHPGTESARRAAKQQTNVSARLVQFQDGVARRLVRLAVRGTPLSFFIATKANRLALTVTLLVAVMVPADKEDFVSLGKLIRFVIGTSALLFGVGVFIGYRAQSQSRNGSETPPQSFGDPHVTPFTVEAIDFSDSNKGKAPNELLETLARRSDGSYVRSYATHSPAGELGTAIEILDTRKRTFSKQEPFTKLITTFHYPVDADAEMRRQSRYWGDCEDFRNLQDSDKDAESFMRLGYRVLKVQTKTNRSTTVFWVAPALDCYPLRQTVTLGSVSTEFLVTKITEGEPSEAPFAVSPGYAEASPSQVESAWLLKYPGHALRGEALLKKTEGLYNRSCSSR